MASSSTVVVTGGSGFVGAYLREELRIMWPGVNVISWDLPQIDITKPDGYREQLRQLQPDWVVHLAAIASVPLAAEQPDLVRRVNVEGTKQLLGAIGDVAPSTRILAVSSAEIYGDMFNEFGEKPMPELPLDQARPLNTYAASKKEMEEIIEGEFLGRCIRVRPFPHFGPGQKEGFVTADFASQVARIEANLQKPAIKVGNLMAQRDFTDVRDVVRAYRLVMEKGKMGEVYHVASGRTIKIQDILDYLLGLAQVKIAVEQDVKRMRPSEVPVAVGDSGKLRVVTGWQPEREWQQTLDEVLSWWREYITA